MSQTIIKNYFINYYNQNKTKECCFNSDEIKNRVKKCVDTSFYNKSDIINKEIGFSNILLGIGGSFLFTKDNLFVLECGLFSCKIHKYNFQDIKFFSVESNILNFKDKRVSKLPFKDNIFFDLLNQIQSELPDVVEQHLGQKVEDDKRIENIKRKRQEDHDLVERNKVLEMKKKKDEINRIETERKRKEEFERIENERKRKEKLESSKSNHISILDKDGNGEIDLIESESFTKILNSNQKKIIEIDKKYIQNFVRISIYIKTKKSNIQKLFQRIKSVENHNELEELVGLLKNQVHTYNLLIFHSINMVISLTESDLITFYEIYECFDKLGVFNSNWENEVSSNLQDINYSIDEVNQSIINLDNNMSNSLQKLMFSIHDMESNIVNSINELTYVTEDSFSSLNHTVGEQLSDINSSLNFNNLLTGIQTYQMYKINQNTKRIG